MTCLRRRNARLPGIICRRLQITAAMRGLRHSRRSLVRHTNLVDMSLVLQDVPDQEQFGSEATGRPGRLRRAGILTMTSPTGFAGWEETVVSMRLAVVTHRVPGAVTSRLRPLAVGRRVRRFPGVLSGLTHRCRYRGLASGLGIPWYRRGRTVARTRAHRAGSGPCLGGHTIWSLRPPR